MFYKIEYLFYSNTNNLTLTDQALKDVLNKARRLHNSENAVRINNEQRSSSVEVRSTSRNSNRTANTHHSVDPSHRHSNSTNHRRPINETPPIDCVNSSKRPERTGSLVDVDPSPQYPMPAKRIKSNRAPPPPPPCTAHTPQSGHRTTTTDAPNLTVTKSTTRGPTRTHQTDSTPISHSNTNNNNYDPTPNRKYPAPGVDRGDTRQDPPGSLPQTAGIAPHASSTSLRSQNPITTTPRPKRTTSARLPAAGESRTISHSTRPHSAQMPPAVVGKTKSQG